MSVRRNIVALLFASSVATALASCSGNTKDQANNNQENKITKTFYKISDTKVGVTTKGEKDTYFLTAGETTKPMWTTGERYTVYKADSSEATTRTGYHEAVGDGSYVPYKNWDNDQKKEFAEAMHFLHSADAATGPTALNPTLQYAQ